MNENQFEKRKKQGVRLLLLRRNKKKIWYRWQDISKGHRFFKGILYWKYKSWNRNKIQ